MKPGKLILISLTVLMFVLIVAPSGHAVSEAGVLFLRIASGARAAGMGEAFVAVADDATATHWNPAGLGAYPLSDSWEETKIPKELQPISAVAVFGADQSSQDTWALTPKGLARHDGKKWHLDEVFSTRTDQTVRSLVKAYFRAKDEELLDAMVSRVAASNNKYDAAYLQNLADTVMASVPEDYNAIESLRAGFDTLVTSWDACLVNWERVKTIGEKFRDGMKDGTLDETELDRINFAVERSKNRFIPENLSIPFGAVMDGNPTSLVASATYLFVGTDKGLVIYDGRSWRTLTTADGLPSDNILTIATRKLRAFIGTDAGTAIVLGAKLSSPDGLADGPEGPVRAIDALGDGSFFAIVGNDLYHFEDNKWSNSFVYTVTLDDTPEKLAERLSIYGTDSEKEIWLDKYRQIVPKEILTQKATAEIPVEEEGENDVNIAESIAGASAEPDSTTLVEEVVETPVVEPTVSGAIKPGDVIEIPFMAELRGVATSVMATTDGHVWIGTDHGVMHFDGKTWTLPGYEDHTATEGETFSAIAQNRGLVDSADIVKYVGLLKRINDIDGDKLTVGQTLKIQKNSASYPVNKVEQRRGVIYVATTNGLIQYDGAKWSQVDMGGLGRANVLDVRASEGQLWYASGNKVLGKKKGRSEYALMHAKWLPSLADDLYYGFFSATHHKEGLGTFGLNATVISFGSILGMDAFGDTTGTFVSYEMAFGLSYGTSITRKLKGGISAKIINSHLSAQGVGDEKGDGITWGFGLDFGLLYQWNPRLNIGLAVSNIGPDIHYVDVDPQGDPMPRNLAFGFAYKLIQSEYYHLLLTAEMNKMLVQMNDDFSQELKEVVFNGGGEFVYADMFAIRAGYIHDEDGKVKTITVGAGLKPIDWVKFDFAYIPSSKDLALANTLRMSLTLLP